MSKYGICDHCRDLTDVDDNAEWEGMQAQLCDDCCMEAELWSAAMEFMEGMAEEVSTTHG